MKTCPACETHSWTDDVLGTKVCPQCKARVNLKPGGVTEAPKAFRVIHRPSKLNRDKVLVNGKVLCACCARPFPLADTLEGCIEGDGTRLVNVQVGWRLIGETFHPATEERRIPKSLRGQICIPCMNKFQGRQVGKVAVPRDERAESILSDVRTNGLPREVDPDPTWAHTKDHSWLAGANAQEPFYDDSDLDEIILLDRMVKRGPLPTRYRTVKHVGKHLWIVPSAREWQRPFAPVTFARTPTPPWYPSETLVKLVNILTAHWAGV